MAQESTKRNEGGDNQASDTVLWQYKCNKHIQESSNAWKNKAYSIKYHYVRELVEEKEVKMEYIHTKEQIVDIFTKPLPKDSYEYLRGKLGVKLLTQVV